MRSFERKNSKASLRGGSGGGTGSMDGHHISNRWPVKKSQKSWPKGPFHLGRSLIIHATTVCVSWEENTSHPINGWMCKESPSKEDVN